MEKVFITGCGIISGLGNGVEKNIQQLKNGKSGIGKAQNLISKYTDRLPFSEVKMSTLNLLDLTETPKNIGLTRTTLLAYVAFQNAINQANLSNQELSSLSTGIISSTTIGGMCHIDELYQDANLKGCASNYVHSYAQADHTKRLINKYNLKGFSSTINTACSSSSNAIMFGARLIKSGRLKRVIVGGTDALGKFTVNGFNSLMILSSSPCKPFDKSRDGLTLGEGAGYLVLEAESVCDQKHKLAEVVGYGNSNDAFHPSTTSEEAHGPTYAMARALKFAQLDPQKIGYINAHGTGTINNDETELTAFKNIFGKNIPSFNSTKSYTGHTLAASGAIESIFSIETLNSGELYQSLNCTKPIYNSGIIHKPSNKEINYVMINAFGFGGNCTSLIYKKV